MITTPALTGSQVRLDPLSAAHAGPLLAAADADRSTYGLTTVPGTAAAMQEYVDRALAEQTAGECVPYAVVSIASGAVVGSTRFLDIACWPGFGQPEVTVAEIGHTWLALAAQRTAVNTEMKYLMLQHAFDQWRAIRISLKTDSRNARSRAAIERLGAKFEGVRRCHVVASDGGVRDSAYYSIVDTEWPAVKAALRERLGQNS